MKDLKNIQFQNLAKFPAFQTTSNPKTRAMFGYKSYRIQNQTLSQKPLSEITTSKVLASIKQVYIL